MMIMKSWKGVGRRAHSFDDSWDVIFWRTEKEKGVSWRAKQTKSLCSTGRWQKMTHVISYPCSSSCIPVHKQLQLISLNTFGYIKIVEIAEQKTSQESLAKEDGKNMPSSPSRNMEMVKREKRSWKQNTFPQHLRSCSQQQARCQPHFQLPFPAGDQGALL